MSGPQSPSVTATGRVLETERPIVGAKHTPREVRPTRTFSGTIAFAIASLRRQNRARRRPTNWENRESGRPARANRPPEVFFIACRRDRQAVRRQEFGAQCADPDVLTKIALEADQFVFRPYGSCARGGILAAKLNQHCSLYEFQHTQAKRSVPCLVRFSTH